MRMVVDSYGVHVEHSRNDGESWHCQAVINLEQAIEFARNLIAFVEQTTPASDDDEFTEWMRREEERADAISMARDEDFWQPGPGYCPEIDDAVESGEQLAF
jgi:hypothetical protein